jgi:RHS repeat-associated protein
MDAINGARSHQPARHDASDQDQRNRVYLMTAVLPTPHYTYNTLDQLSSMTDPTGVQWQFGYDAAGDRTRTYYNATSPTPASYGAEEQVGFDNAGRINLIKATGNSGAATLGDTTYCYSPYVSGQACPTTSASTDTETLRYSDNLQSGVITQYAYDAGNRLKTATPTSGTTYSYSYDSDGNLTTGATAGTLAYNSANQISTSGYGYDKDGSLTTDPSNGTLAYNDASQLTGASAAAGGGGGSAAETIAYAGPGQNQPLTDGSATAITYGQADQYGQPRVDSYTTAGATDYIIRDPQGDPLGIISAGKSYMYLTDNVGSITGITGSCGCSDAAYTYTPYGALVSKSAGSGGALVTQNLLGYTGALTDAFAAGSTGYVHDGARWYNPKTGAFAGQDTSSYLANPANGNRYAYAADNPANNTDPTGQNAFTDILGGVASVATAVGGSLGILYSEMPLAVGFAALGLTGVGVVVGLVFIGIGIYEATKS